MMRAHSAVAWNRAPPVTSVLKEGDNCLRDCVGSTRALPGVTDEANLHLVRCGGVVSTENGTGWNQTTTLKGKARGVRMSLTSFTLTPVVTVHACAAAN